MSFVAIITGLLIWFSVPPLFARRISDQSNRIVRWACMIIGIATIVGGVIWNFVK